MRTPRAERTGRHARLSAAAPAAQPQSAAGRALAEGSGLQRDAFKALQAKAAENRAKLRTEIDKAGVDLKGFAQLRDRLREQMRTDMQTSHQQVRAAWFGLYDSLDANQREQVRVRSATAWITWTRGMHRGGPHGDMQG